MDDDAAAARRRSSPSEPARLAAAHLEIVRFQARQVSREVGRNAAEEELVSVGSEALVLAARTHDPALAPFEPYAMKKVRWAMLDFVRRDSHVRAATARRRASAVLALEELATPALAPSRDDEAPTEEECLASFRADLAAHAGALFVGLTSSPLPDAETPEADLMRARARHALESAVARLPERERALVEGHYFRSERFDEMATTMGISKSRVSRLHTRALALLGDLLKDHHQS